MNTKIYQNRPEDTKNCTNLYLESHDYPIYYVNIDLRHQYGMSVAESQTILRAKRAQRPRAMEKRMFSQAIYVPLIYIFHQLHVVIVSSFLLCANIIFHIYSCRCL